jgi:signal transduction histidine kinase
MPGRLAKLAFRPQLPRRTVRLRLTLLYGALFLVSGAALLAITNLLVNRATDDQLVISVSSPAERKARLGLGDAPAAIHDGLPKGLQREAARLREQAANQRDEQMDQLLIQSGIALALMSVASIGLGWLMAGRVLRPLRTMTATTRRISEHNLHERLALAGPDDELKDLGDTIDGLLARLEAAFDAQRRFVANASHELRTPLSMMRTSLDVAAGKPGPAAPQIRVLDGKLREGLDRADRLLESFLTLARAERGALPDRSSVPLSDAVAAALEDRHMAIAAKRIALHRELAEANATGSGVLLARMVENVIDNAIRHNEPSGWIRVVTRSEGDTALVLVESGGPPLEPGEVRELAQPFRRLGVERTNSQNGVGLGLSIVRAIAEAHGGELELRARAKGGLRVEIRLARARTASLTDGATA